ncbi:hypothetical protein [Amycolatopsis aidingensis]|uniref:hypothetical protein n=1 Tax=Amycolatopsis aidingensis TaxID=2842453 RepID=UPI001C0BF663|nr:hypothetical protein [Amycolatopsis aidingensis]
MSPLVWAILLVGVFVVIALGLRTVQRGAAARPEPEAEPAGFAETAAVPETAPVASR